MLGSIYGVRMNVTSRSNELKNDHVRSMARGVGLLTERTWKLGPWKRHHSPMAPSLQVTVSVTLAHILWGLHTAYWNPHHGLSLYLILCALCIAWQFIYQEKNPGGFDSVFILHFSGGTTRET